MRTPPTLDARDNLAIMGLLQALGEVGTPMTPERREEAVTAFAALLRVLYPDAEEEAE